MQPSTGQMYEIRLGSRPVARREAISPQQAVIDYLLSIGCRRKEIVTVGSDAATWRGALYAATAISTDQR